MISRSSLKLGHVGSKTRSVGLKIEKPFDLSRGHRGHIFHEIFMNIGQNVYLDDI